MIDLILLLILCIGGILCIDVFPWIYKKLKKVFRRLAAKLKLNTWLAKHSKFRKIPIKEPVLPMYMSRENTRDADLEQFELLPSYDQSRGDPQWVMIDEEPKVLVVRAK